MNSKRMQNKDKRIKSYPQNKIFTKVITYFPKHAFTNPKNKGFGLNVLDVNSG